MELSNWCWTNTRSRWSEGVGFYTTDGISMAGQIILGSELASDKKLVRITDMLGRDVNGDEKDDVTIHLRWWKYSIYQRIKVNTYI